MRWKPYGTGVRIVLLHVPDCPNLALTRDRILEALDVAEIVASVDEVEVATVESAADVGMHGSPTILIDGVDPFDAGSSEASMSCRLFDTPDGFEGAPTVSRLIEVVSHR